MTAASDLAVHLTVRILLAAMFAAAARHKAEDFPTFAATLRAYRCLPAVAVPAVAALLVAAEATAAFALLAWPVAGAAATIALLTLYSAAIALNLARGRRDIDCGCRGPGHRQALSEWLLARNAALVAAAALLLRPAQPRPLTAIDAFTIGGAVSALALLWVAANQLLERTPSAAGARQ